jgi:hypothetical protein
MRHASPSGGTTTAGVLGEADACAMVAQVTHENSAAQPSNTTFAVRHTSPAASKSGTPPVQWRTQSSAREGQSTGRADTEERLNTCNWLLFTRAYRPYAIQHRPSAVLVFSVLPAIRGQRSRQNATRWRDADARPRCETWWAAAVRNESATNTCRREDSSQKPPPRARIGRTRRQLRAPAPLVAAP